MASRAKALRERIGDGPGGWGEQSMKDLVDLVSDCVAAVDNANHRARIAEDEVERLRYELRLLGEDIGE